MIRNRKSRIGPCFGGCPKKPKSDSKASEETPEEKKKEEAIKKALLEAAERRKVDKELRGILKGFKGRYSILQLLLLLRNNYPKNVLERAIERVEMQKCRNELSIKDVVFFEQFKESLKHPNQEE